MYDIPRVTLEVEHMKETITHAFANRALDYSSELKLAIDRACHPEVIQATIDKAAREAVTSAVENAVKRWWATSEEGQALIQQAITARLIEEAAFWKGR
jgi:hypothetical protein